MPPHPQSTLFPCTTLFRSPFLEEEKLMKYAQFALFVALTAAVSWCRQATAQNLLTDPSFENPALFTSDGPDRKSTRLNSSHLGISYAVFCLKKKTSFSSVP